MLTLLAVLALLPSPHPSHHGRPHMVNDTPYTWTTVVVTPDYRATQTCVVHRHGPDDCTVTFDLGPRYYQHQQWRRAAYRLAP